MARKKTERIFTPIDSMSQFARKLAEFGEKTAFRWLDKEKKIQSMSYAALSEQILTEAAGLEAVGLAGKRVAVIGETSVAWVTTYISVIAAGGYLVIWYEHQKLQF